MADNVTITAGSGTTVAADEITDGTLGTVKVQYVKLMDGTLDGTSKATVGANGLKVDGSGVTQPVSGTVTAANTAGDVASGTSDSGNPVKQGFLAKTSLPTAVSDGQRVNGISDKFGRQITLPITERDLIGTQTTTISASTSETTIVTAAASTFNDLIMLVVSNTSASTNTRIDFRDTTAGSVLFSLQAPGNNTVGFAPPVAIPQTSVNTNWTAQCASSTTDIRIYAVFAKNK